MSKTLTTIETSEYILAGGGNPLTITSTGGVETSGGTAIYGGSSQAWTIINAGVVSSGVVADGTGIDLRAGGTIGNTGQISGFHYAIRIRGSAGTVTNAGSIAGETDGVVLFAGGSVSNAAAGVIAGTINVGVYVSGGAATVTNAGTISGFALADAVQIISGYTDRVIVDPNAVFSGKVEGGNTIGATAVSTLELASGASTGTLAGLGTKYVDFAQVSVDTGASWHLSGNNTLVAGAVLTDSGILTNTAALADNGTLNGGGILINTGDISVSSAGGLALTGGAVTNTTLGTIVGSFDGLRMTGGGSVVNAGTIIDDGAEYQSVYLGGASLLNQAGGVIEGGYTAIRAINGTVTNNGTISDSGAVSDGIAASGDSLIVNTTNATINAPNFAGIETYNIFATVTNAGLISGHYGLLLIGGGIVTNASTGTIAGGLYGIKAAARATMTNAGTIIATDTKSFSVYLHGGSLTNLAGGTIQGGYGAVRTGGGTITSIINHGLIQGVGPLADGIAAFNAGVIVNAANATILGQNFCGIETYNIFTTIANAGLVSGHYGIFLINGGKVTNASGGTITGNAFGIEGVGLTTLVNAGTIAATGTATDSVILTAGYANRVVIDPGAVFTHTVEGGNTIGAAAVSTLELASGASTGTLTALGERYVDFGQIIIDPGASWLLGGGTVLGAGITLTVNQATLNAGSRFLDNGTVLLDPSTMTVNGLSGTGSVAIGSGSTLLSQGAIEHGMTIAFDGTSGALVLDLPRSEFGIITGFTPDDTIELVNVNDVTSVQLESGDTLQIDLNKESPINLSMSGDFTGEAFHYAINGTSTFITESIACFASGTSIRTDRGAIPVETLAIGDRVVTLSGVPAPIRWIGRRRLDLARHPAADRARPIRIRTDAFGRGAPNRDLFLSPDHAVLCNCLLIPARLLVNGASIQRDTACRHVTYYHVELAEHGILLAENLTVESYLDTGNRGMFDNTDAPLTLHPDFTNHQARRTTGSCAPFADDPADVEPVWRDLADRAVRLGLRLPAAPETTQDPALHILAGGSRLAPASVTGERYIFALPRADITVRLISRHAAPSETMPWLVDDRRLGVVLSGLTCRSGTHVIPIPLDHPALHDGWWHPEWHGPATLRRWTDGDAAVCLAGLTPDDPNPCLLEIEIAGTVPYPRRPPAQTIAL